MSEVSVLGTVITSSSTFDTGVDNHQYAIFNLKPEYISSYENETFLYWLKDVAFYGGFVIIGDHQESGFWNATHSNGGVRPRFLIG